MTPTTTRDIDEVLDRVWSWPPGSRIELARRILESRQTSSPGEESERRHATPDEIRAMLRVKPPVPDDETVRQWIHEHRMEKYGK